MMPNIGPLEIVIVLGIALMVFGPKRLPELGRSLGSGIRGFGQAMKGDDEPEQLEPEAASARADSSG
jgi:sec-independent protein translocase protein TatA